MVEMAPEFSPRREKTVCNRTAAAEPTVLDLDHLARYTVGNRELEEELLRLFRAQMRTQVTAIAGAGDADAWRFATHTLKGVARSLGAGAIAETAAALEKLGHGAESGRSAPLLEALHDQVEACEREIDRLIGR
jgi:HPt (histidine-containing phosphotransfer) domain-containing protein